MFLNIDVEFERKRLKERIDGMVCFLHSKEHAVDDFSLFL